MPGAIFSTGYATSLAIGPLPSIGSPRVLTTRPSSPLPTGTCSSLPVARTSSPSSRLRVLAEDDDADLGLLEAERQARDAVAEVEHLVQHHVAEAFDLGDAVADLTDDTDVLLDRCRFRACDLCLDVLYQVGHNSVLSPQSSVLGPASGSGLTTHDSYSRLQNRSESAVRRPFTLPS